MVTGRNETGKVWLVGAGPGDPGLLTVRGLEALRRADVVVYDALANPALLKECPDAEAIYVGKRAGAHSMRQEEIEAVLIEKAKAGRRVVRLKGGDPFVFGRGGEECEALAKAGVRFEVVPGITAGVAAAAYAGIPVTHRDFNSSFTLITGHERGEGSDEATQRRSDEGGEGAGIDWAVVARLPCVAFYMGVKSLGRICGRLMEHGMDARTPAAAIQWGTTPRQRTVTGTVGDLAERVREAGLGAPAITIIGSVVALRERLRWFEDRPLFGRTVVVTRTRQQASALGMKLAELGARVIEAPTIEIEPGDRARVVEALHRAAAGGYDWAVFTSGNGVWRTKAMMLEAGLDARIFAGMKVAAIGEATATALAEQMCVRADLIPPRALAEALGEALAARGEIAGKRFLLLRAEIGRPVLVERLRGDGAAVVDDVAVYETQCARSLPAELIEALDAGEADWVTFTSGSTVRNFAALLGGNYAERLRGVKLASIGAVTTGALREVGLEPAVEAARSDIDGLVEAVLSAEGRLE